MRSTILCLIVSAMLPCAACDKSPDQRQREQAELDAKVAEKLHSEKMAEVRTRGLTAADHLCGNEDIYYPPLAKLDHVMPAYTLENSFQGEGLNETWSVRLRRSGFIGTFQVTAE